MRTPLMMLSLLLAAIIGVWLVFAEWTDQPEPLLREEVPQVVPERMTKEGGVEVYDADVVIYGTTSAGVGAVKGLSDVQASLGSKLKVAVISTGQLFESPLAQGLSVEDRYPGSRDASGFYQEFRERVVNRYTREGIEPFVDGERLVYEPEAAREVLQTFLDEQEDLLWVTGRLLAAVDDESRYVLVEESGGILRLNTRFFIDASPEGDLGRLLGGDYMIGRTNNVYNDVAGPRPERPSFENNFATAPQRYSMLLTLSLEESGTAQALAELDHPWYDGSSYGPGFSFGEHNRVAFADSWSMENVLPNAKRELNEHWSDYTDKLHSFEWVMYPALRSKIRRDMVTYVVNKVRYLQEHGYPELGIATIPSRPYVREGVRFVGEEIYRGRDIDAGQRREVVAVGTYARYDRHDVMEGSSQNSDTATAFVPMGALMPKGQPYLLTPTAISSDDSAYSSAVRMESVRGNMGAAAGVIVGVADSLGSDLHSVPYELVRDELIAKGHALD